MSDIFGIGTSALLAYSNALNTVGHNVANANTPGYSRQRVNLESLPGQLISGNVIGNGVHVRNVQRLNDRFIFQQLVADDSGYGRADTLNTYTGQLDSLLSGSSSGLGSSLNNFFTSLNGVAANPTSTGARQTAIGSMQSLADRFADLQGQIDGLGTQLDGQVSTQVTQLNTYAQQYAQLNAKIVSATLNAPGQAPNDLLDQRDQLLRNMAAITTVKTTDNPDGTSNVFVGNGQALVLGQAASTLAVGNDTYGRPRNITINGGGNSVEISGQLSGGTLGAVYELRKTVLDPAAAQLGRIAVATAKAINAQNAKGMDQYGQLGQALFNTPVPKVTGSLKNTGSAGISADVVDTTALQATSYTMSYDGTNWTLKDASSGAVVPMTGTGTATDPFVAAGVSFTVSGTANAGDSFLVEPVSRAAGSIGLATTDAARIAAAIPVQTAAGTSNGGTASISSATVLDETDPNLLQPVTIQFTSGTSYTINGAGPYTYTDGGSISLNGWSVRISGTPLAGDSFTVKPNNGSSSDGGNASLLANVANLQLLNGGLDTLSSSNSALVGQVGAQAQAASAQLSTEDAIRTQDQAQRDSLSGVNLDEEAADLQRYQQAYQAAAQIISTANSLFQTLIDALR